MPKQEISEEEQKNRLTRAYIAKGMELYGLTEDEVAVKIRCVKRTFQNKRKRPETFTLKELRKLCIVLKLSKEEKAEIM